MVVTIAASKTYQSDLPANIEVQHVATVIECLITIGRPNKMLRVEKVGKLRLKYAKEALLFLVRCIDRIPESVGDLAAIGLASKRSNVSSATSETIFDLVKGTRQQ